MSLSADKAFALLRDPSTGCDPVPLYESFLGTEGPVRLRGGDVVVARHRDVAEVLRNPRFGKLPPPPMPTRALRVVMRLFVSLDPPDHTRLRRSVAAHFTPAAVAAHRSTVEDLAGATLDGAGTSFDLVHDYAYAVPFRFICALLGAHEQDRDELSAWTRLLAATLDDPLPMRPKDGIRTLGAVVRGRIRPRQMFRAVHGIVSYARDCVRRSDAPIAATLRSDIEAGDITADEAAATWVLLFIAGHETSANLITNTAHALFTHPDSLAAIRSGHQTVSAAIEETLRWDPPAPMNGRLAHDDVQLGSQRIDKGTFVHTLVGAANRDPDVFEHADRFEPDRPSNAHLGFGQGIHFCLGAHLARLETEVALQQLLARDVLPSGEAQRRRSFSMSGFERFPVEIPSSRAHTLIL